MTDKSDEQLILERINDLMVYYSQWHLLNLEDPDNIDMAKIDKIATDPDPEIFEMQEAIQGRIVDELDRFATFMMRHCITRKS